jgi:hypothetical protein
MTPSPMPDAEEVLFGEPLYKPWSLPDIVELSLLLGNYRKDGYCIHCGNGSLWESSGPPKLSISMEGVYGLTLRCMRHKDHIYWFNFLIDAGTIQKIGQYPSLADIATHKVRRYRKVLGDRLAELTRADGLAAHGVGIGSFVYLRRIFEGLVQEARGTAKLEPHFDEELFDAARMDEKIGMLRHHLPEFLVENRAIYGILSVGIHELSEETCLGHYDVVRTGIVMILEEKLERSARAQRLKEAAQKIADARRTLEQKRSGVVEPEPGDSE